jgi:transcriptional regulator with XRE-family HTH domain
MDKNRIIDNILTFNGNTMEDLAIGIAERVKQRRLELNLTQQGLALRSGVSFGSYRRFETSGEISLKSLIRLSFTLGMSDDFTRLFSEPQYLSMDDMLKKTSNSKRKRGRVKE